MKDPKKSKLVIFFVKRSLTIGEILRSTFSTISKKSNQEGVFRFLHPDPQLDQNLKPTRSLCGQLLFIYLSIHRYTV